MPVKLNEKQLESAIRNFLIEKDGLTYIIHKIYFK